MTSVKAKLPFQRMFSLFHALSNMTLQSEKKLTKFNDLQNQSNLFWL